MLFNPLGTTWGKAASVGVAARGSDRAGRLRSDEVGRKEGRGNVCNGGELKSVCSCVAGLLPAELEVTASLFPKPVRTGVNREG